MELKGWLGASSQQDRKRNKNNSFCTYVRQLFHVAGRQLAMVLGAKSRVSGNESDGLTGDRF